MLFIVLSWLLKIVYEAPVPAPCAATLAEKVAISVPDIDEVFDGLFPILSKWFKQSNQAKREGAPTNRDVALASETHERHQGTSG